MKAHVHKKEVVSVGGFDYEYLTIESNIDGDGFTVMGHNWERIGNYKHTRLDDFTILEAAKADYPMADWVSCH